MSWRERLTTLDGESAFAGDFRGAVFLVRSGIAQLGRKNELHEYPLSDIPWVEDSGRKTRKFKDQLFVAGDNYDIDRNALMEAFEKPGPGLLQHPFFGQMQASAFEVEVTYSSVKSGMARFTLTWVVGGELVFPSVTVLTAEATKKAAEKTIAESKAEFSEQFDVLGQAADAVQNVVDEVAATMAAVDDAIGDVTGPISDMIRAPAEMAGAVLGGINRIRTTITGPGRAFGIYKALFNAGSNTTYPTVTASQRRTAANIEALQHLVQRAAIAEAANITADRQYATSNDALRDADDLAAAIDAHTSGESVVDGAPINDAVYGAMSDLRAAVMVDLRERGAQLPKLTSHTPAATLPALVLAYNIYGDAARADELIARNRIAHPGFVPGGEALEVLTDA